MQVEPEPVELVDGDFSRGLVLLCDHARNRLPPRYSSLGLPASQFERHIAYDIGARGVTLGLAARLGVPAVLSTFSRLLIDPNRGEDDPTMIMRLSDGTVIPGNHPISRDEIELRVETYHRPYHRAVGGTISQIIEAGVIPAIFSVHSFTHSWKGKARPWDVTILWDCDPRFVQPLLDQLHRIDGIVAADNEPYDGALKNDTMYRHCTKRGLAHALIEIRQDLIGDDAGIGRWVDLLAPILQIANGLAEVHEVRHFKSRADADCPTKHSPAMDGENANG